MPVTQFSSWRPAVALAALAMSTSVCAQEFADLERRLESHPELAALRHEAQSQRERASAAGALPDPTVVIGVSNFPVFDPAFDRYLPTSKTLGLRQQIPGAALREARATTSRADAARIDALHAMHLDALRASLISALVERRRIERERELVTEQAGLYDELMGIVESEIEGGRSLEPDIDRITVRRSRLASSLVVLDQEAAQIDARLIELVGVAADTPPPAQTARSWGSDASRFHAVQLALVEIARTDSGVAAARAAWRPNWNIELTYQQRESGRDNAFDGDDWITGAVGFTVPLWANSSQAPRLRAASADREAARSRFAAAARRGVADYAAQAAIAERAERSLALLTAELDALEAQRDAERIRYETGEGDYRPVIERQVDVLERRIEQERERARRERAIAAMNRLVVAP